MGLFGNWFKGKPKDAVDGGTDQIRPQERAVRYDPGLVAGLRHDHRELVSMYGQLGQDVRDGNYHRIPNALLAFKTRLEAHVLIENVRFYAYVENALMHDNDSIAAIRDFRREMSALVRGVAEFVRRYQHRQVGVGNAGDFMREYDEIGKALVLRIEREEGGLYPLYAP